MNRTALRVAIVAVIGAVGLFVLSRLDSDTESVESPTIHTGPLGDVGSGLGASRGRRILVNPARDVVVRLMKPTTPTGDAVEVFEPVAEVRGRTVEYLSDRKQLFVDPVLVYELPRTDLRGPDRRARFEGVVNHVPEEASPSRVLPDDIEKRRPTHLRIQAARAEVTDLDTGQPTVRFLGEPPHGVAITVFVDGGIAAFEGRTDQLTCAIDKRDDRGIIHVTTDRLVRLFSADGRMTLRGQGFAAHAIEPEKDGERTVHVRLARAVRFTFPRAEPAPKAGDDESKRRVVAAEGWVECDGPATMRMREIATVVDGKPATTSRIEHLSFTGGVRGAMDSVVQRRKDGAPDGFDHLRQRFESERARVSFLEQTMRAIDLDGSFRFVADHAKTAERDVTTLPNRATLVAERARIGFVDGEPRTIRAYAIGTRPVRTPFSGFGVPPMPSPVHRAPRITGSFELDGVDHGGFEATCRGDVTATVDSIPKDAADPEGRSSLALREVMLHDHPRLELRGLRATRPDALVPGDSTLTATDTIAIRWPDPRTQAIAFDGQGDVRLRSLLGQLSAQHLYGTIHGSRRWRLVADGAPVLDRPILGRGGGDRVDDVLKTLMLDRGGPEPRAGEAAGRLTVRSARTVFESVGVDDDNAGLVRFVGPVRIVQHERGADPITLDCDALRLGFAPAGKDTEGRSDLAIEAVATGSVVLDAGRGTRIAGDELVATRPSRDAEPHARIRGWPARLSAKSDIGDEVVVDGRTIELSPATRRAIVNEGVQARLLPAAARVRGRLGEHLSVPGSNRDYVARLELDAERAEIEWAERGGLASFQALEAVRLRGFDRRTDDASARLLQWGEADELHHVARDGGGDKVHRTTTLIGTREAPVRLAFRDPKVRHAGDHYRLDVPRLVIDEPPGKVGRSVTGHGAGTLFFLSQDNLFGTKMSGGSRQEERITMRFRNGFTMRDLTRHRSRIDFPGGGEVRSASLDGRTNGWLTADDAFALRVGTTKRKEDENARVVESGFAEGNVRFRYLDDTEGECDALTWERGTNTITVAGDPVQIEHAGNPIRGKTATYDLVTGRFEATRISGTLRRRFDERDRRP